jgi:beta-lactamase class A
MIDSRRRIVAGLASLPLLTLLPGYAAAKPVAPAFDRLALQRELARLERESGGRLGVSLLDTGSGAHLEWRGEERFPMCSTFKLLLVAATLAQAGRGEESLERRIAISKAELVTYSPFTETRAGADASVLELCEAAMTRSDNTAANCLLAALGGPAALTAFARALGDPHTRLDRIETELNSAIAGDPRDTTTPRAMRGNLQRLLLGDALPPALRTQLLDWMRGNQTGDARLRAGLPKDWQVGDKTGSGANGTTNDIAILWPPGRAPLLIASYLTGSKLESPQRDAIHAALARALSAA